MANSKIKKTAALLLAGSLMFTVSCANKDGADGKPVAAPETGDFTFVYPESWEETENGGVYSISAPADENAPNVTPANISVTNFKIGPEFFEDVADAENPDPAAVLTAAFNAYVTDYMDKLGKEFGTLEWDGKITDLPEKVGENPAKSAEFRITNTYTGELVVFETVFVLCPVSQKDAYCYFITFTANGEENFKAHEGALKAVLSEFTFK